MLGDLLITGGLLWTGADPVHPQGAVLIKDGVIAFAGPADGLPPTGPQIPVLDAGGGLIMPGLINAHCHGAMSLFRGLADDLPLQAWLTEHMFPAEARWMDPEAVELGSLLSAAEMLLSGTTCVGDSYFHAGAAARAYEAVGLRAVVAQGLIDFPAPGVPDPARGIDACREFLQAWHGRSPLITPGLFAHSPYTCGPDTLAAVAELAKTTGAPLFTHLAETKAERGMIQDSHGQAPLEYLAGGGFLEALTSAAHGVWLHDSELAHLAQMGVALVHCSESNQKLGSGVARVDKWLSAGLTAGLGTDGPASNNDLDMFSEMGSTARLAKVMAQDPAILPAKEVLAMATTGSAQALGLGRGLGMLIPGAPGDVVVLNTAAAHLTPMYSVPSTLVYAASGGDLKHTVVAGKVLVRDRELLTMDLTEITNRASELAQKIQAG